MNSSRGIVTVSMIYIVVLFILSRGLVASIKSAVQRASGAK